MKSLYRMFLTAALIAVSLFYVHASAECEHSWSYSPAGEGSHTASCSLCGETKNQTHSLSSSKTPASCDKPSVITYTCAQCGYSASYPDGEPSANHAWGAFSVTKQATCKQEGTETRTCAACGAKDSRAIEKTEHNYGDWQKYDEKWHIRYCKVCDWAYKGSHRLDSGKIVSEATESKLGEITYTCRVCTDTFSRAVNINGTIFVKTPEDVLDNGSKYLLVDHGEENESGRREVKLPGNHLIEITKNDGAELSLYANMTSGNYAGLSLSAPGATAEILPAGDGDTLIIEFLKLSKDTELKIRIFNSDGSVAIANAGGKQLFVSQKKTAEGASVTLVMQIVKSGNHWKGSARMYKSDEAEVIIGYGKNEYSAVPAGANKLLGQAVWDYHKTTGKLTVNALNENEKADGIVYSVLEGNVHLLTASDIKKAQGAVKTSSKDSVWRLRITFPCGYAIETPGYLSDGTFKHVPAKALMDETDLSAPAVTLPPEETPETVTPGTESAVPDELSPETEPVKDAPSVEAPPVLTGSAELIPGVEAAYTSKDLSSLTTVYDGHSLIVDASGLPDGFSFVSATIIQSGSGFNFRITNAYSLPFVYEVPSREVTIEVSVHIKDADGGIRTLEAGNFSVTPE